MKNFFLKCCLKVLQKFIPRHNSQHRFLIVSTTALGDTLWATPAIESIRKYFPHCYLAVLTSKIGVEVLEKNPYVDRVFLLKEPVLLHGFSLWKLLYQERFDTILVFHASQRLTLPLCSLLGATHIIGSQGINKGLDALLTQSLPLCHEHEIVRRLQIARKVGVYPATEQLSFFGASIPVPLESPCFCGVGFPPNLNPPPSLSFLSLATSAPLALIQIRRASLQNSGTFKWNGYIPSQPRTGGPWIALHPGSKDSFKRWPKEKFIELGKLLKQKMSCEILVTGNETALKEEIASQIPGAYMDESRPLHSFGALLKQMDLLVSNDTGPVHLACALSVPVVAIYASTDPALCGPHLAPLAKSISRKATCEPCLKRKCRLPFCFLQIGVEEVYQAIQNLIGKSNATRSHLHL